MNDSPESLGLPSRTNNEPLFDKAINFPEDFRTIREQRCVKSGILQHVFLFVIPECRASYPEAYYPWLWAIDPDWSLDESDEDGYDGRVPVNRETCYQKFDKFVSTNQYSLKQLWQDYHDLCKQREHTKLHC